MANAWGRKQNRQVRGGQGERLYTSLKILAWVTLAAMAVAIVYGATIAVRYWSGIGV